MFDIATISSHNLISFLNIFGDDLLRATISLFAVINPIGTIPLFASMTQKMQKVERDRVLKTTVITASALLMIFAVAGTQILSIFGITISSFMIAGGILLFVVSIELLTHGGWRFGGTVSDESGVVPLAFPLLAGPGAITTVILSFQMSGLMVTILSIAIVMGITYVVFFLTGKIYKILGRRGSLIITRIFAVLIAAIAVQYVVDGLKTI
ncbi:MAG: MarC family protein [Candidatus Nitrosocosmicus sp.]|nr:MarC family protein [Candidatus Nitrosocosmicus sp.]MDN5868924.1 MarC family protein [Candidatus Nitrosocosmicus sp.]